MFEKSVYEEKLNEMFEKYVPMSGKADTVGGEIVRAMCRIGYRWWNDGDIIGNGYGNETCNAAARFLMEKCEDGVRDAVCDIWGCNSDEVYDAGLHVLEKKVVEFLEEFPELFERENTEDMWEFGAWEDTHYEEEEEEEEYEDDWEEDDEDVDE